MTKDELEAISSMTRDEHADALAREAIASICQPQRCEVFIRALAKLAKGEDFWSACSEMMVRAAAPVGPRAHCAEHPGWRSDCDACAAAVDAKQSVLHLHDDGSVTVRTGPEAVAEWEQAMQRGQEEPWSRR